MNRREFLRQTSLFAAAGFWAQGRLLAQSDSGRSVAKPAASAKSASAFGQFRPLRRNVGTFVGRGGTIGWMVSRGALVIVDTQFPDTAAICLEGLPDRNGRPIDVVLNTHHHADHTGGNPVFRPVAKNIVAQANVPRLQFEAAKRAEADPKATVPLRLDQQVYADVTFPEVWRREFGDETITAQFHGPAHTGGDAVIMFEKANVVHMGDLVFNRIYPVIDRPAGASVRGWITALEDAIKTYPSDAIYIFGHGNPKFGVTGTQGDLVVMRDYWAAILALVEKGVAAGKSRAEVVALENLSGFPDFHAPSPNRLSGNLGAAYDELTTKKG